MLNRALELRPAIKEFFFTVGGLWLDLTDDEWHQLKYFIDLTKPFCKFTKLINSNTKSLIHYIYKIYNKLLDYLDRSKELLVRKTKI